MKIHIILLLFAACQLISARHEDDFDLSDSNEIDNRGSSEEIECPENNYFSIKDQKCLSCSVCGPDFYERKECGKHEDTVCGACISRKPILTDDFFDKCQETQDDYKKWRAVLDKDYEKRIKFEQEDGRDFWIVLSYILLFCLIPPTLIVSVAMCYKMRRNYTRVINVVPPPLTEVDEKNIIYALDKLREKAGKRRYNVLPEEV